VRTIQPLLSKKLEECGISVFNNSFVSEICNHKGKTIEYVKKNSDIPTIPTTVHTNSELSPSFLSRYPCHVIKAVDGHGGRQVFRTSDDWELIRSGIGSSDYVIQPFINGPGKDLRLYVIGKKIVGAVERQAPDGFRANYSLGGHIRSYRWGVEEEKLAEKICRLFSFGLVGIDLLMTEEGKWILNEIEDVVGARMLYQCQPDCHLLEKYFEFIISQRRRGRWNT
jgi:glutathione synthase/RimK-type ligase-like ATP-grasp enzyme